MMFTQPENVTLDGKSGVRDVSPSTRSTCDSGDELDVSRCSSFSEENESTFVASPRKEICLPPLQANLKVKNTFLDMMDDALEEPAARRRATSAPPARVLGSEEEREALPPSPAGSPRGRYIASSSEQKVNESTAMQQSFPQDELMKMDAAALYQQAQSARLAAAALRAEAAMQHQVMSDPLANDGSCPKQMMWVMWVPIAPAPQQSFPQEGMEKSAMELQMEAQRAHLGAAALRAQVRLEAAENGTNVEESTSLMLRNIPLDLTRNMFLKMIDAEGFAGKYDLIYLPTDFKTSANLGYAFVNLTANSHAVRMQEKFEGFCRWGTRSAKKCVAQWSSTQGLVAYIHRYRNSPVMHGSVPEEAKPMLFKHGVRVAFPAPTRKLKAPQRQ